MIIIAFILQNVMYPHKLVSSLATVTPIRVQGWLLLKATFLLDGLRSSPLMGALSAECLD